MQLVPHGGPVGGEGGEQVLVAVAGCGLAAHPAEDLSHPTTGKDVALQRRRTLHDVCECVSV